MSENGNGPVYEPQDVHRPHDNVEIVAPPMSEVNDPEEVKLAQEVIAPLVNQVAAEEGGIVDPSMEVDLQGKKITPDIAHAYNFKKTSEVLKQTKNLIHIMEGIWTPIKEQYGITDEQMMEVFKYNNETVIPKPDFIPEPVLDENGEQVLDDKGNPVMTEEPKYDPLNGLDTMPLEKVEEIFGKDSKIIHVIDHQITIDRIKEAHMAIYNLYNAHSEYKKMEKEFVQMMEEHERISVTQLEKAVSGEIEVSDEDREKARKKLEEHYDTKFLNFMVREADKQKEFILKTFNNASRLEYLINRARNNMERLGISAMFIPEMANFEKRYLDERYHHISNCSLLFFLHYIVYGRPTSDATVKRRVQAMVHGYDKLIRKQLDENARAKVLTSIMAMLDIFVPLVSVPDPTDTVEDGDITVQAEFDKCDICGTDMWQREGINYCQNEQCVNRFVEGGISPSASYQVGIDLAPGEDQTVIIDGVDLNEKDDEDELYNLGKEFIEYVKGEIGENLIVVEELPEPQEVVDAGNIGMLYLVTKSQVEDTFLIYKLGAYERGEDDMGDDIGNAGEKVDPNTGGDLIFAWDIYQTVELGEPTDEQDPNQVEMEMQSEEAPAIDISGYTRKVMPLRSAPPLNPDPNTMYVAIKYEEDENGVRLFPVSPENTEDGILGYAYICKDNKWISVDQSHIITWEEWQAIKDEEPDKNDIAAANIEDLGYTVSKEAPPREEPAMCRYCGEGVLVEGTCEHCGLSDYDPPELLPDPIDTEGDDAQVVTVDGDPLGQTFTAGEAGKYRIEVWLPGYRFKEVQLEAGETVYLRDLFPEENDPPSEEATAMAREIKEEFTKEAEKLSFTPDEQEVFQDDTPVYASLDVRDEGNTVQ